jgi:tetratricopeptide (TPR) repeat protein
MGNFIKAIDELKLRIANDPEDVPSRVLLARLVYQQTKDVPSALKYLDEAEKFSPKAILITAGRVTILKAEKRLDEARKLLDIQVQETNDFNAYLLRAEFLAGIGNDEQAEKDYQHLTTLSKKGEGHALLAAFYYKRNQLDNSIQACEAGIKAFPENLSLPRQLLKSLLTRKKTGDVERVKKILSALEKKTLDDPYLLGMQASLLLQDGTLMSTRKAEQLLDRVVQLEPTMIDAYLTLINLAMNRRDLTRAREIAIQAQGLNPLSTKLLLARASIERDMNNPGMAIELAKMVLKEEPRNMEGLNILIGAAIMSRNPEILEEAQTLLKPILKEKPGDDTLQVGNALILDALKQTGEGIAGLDAYSRTRDGQKSLSTFLALGKLYRMLGDYGKSSLAIEKARQLAPDNSQVVKEQINLLAGQQKFDEVTKLVSSYLGSSRQKDPTVVMMGVSVLDTSGVAANLKEAKLLCEQMMTLWPQIVEAQTGVALLAYQMGDVNQAEEIYRKVLKQDPNNVQALNDLAWILAEARKDYPSALKLVEKGIHLDPKNIYLLDTRGFIYSHLPGRLTDAHKDFEKCLELSPTMNSARATALLQLGRIHTQLGEIAQARKYMEEALLIDKKTKVLSDQERQEINETLKKVLQK